MIDDQTSLRLSFCMDHALKIAQMSDLHLSADAGPHRDIPVREQFVRTLERALQAQPDALVLSGDLAANHGEIGAYQFLQDCLDPLNIPVFLMAGNHDVADTLNELFPLSGSGQQRQEYNYQIELQGYPLIFLDTSTKRVSHQQLDWLEAVATAYQDKEVLLFLHHPPVDCACAFMDRKYPLQNRDETWRLIRRLKNVNRIFCGHYHSDKIVQADEKYIYLCPSTMMQIHTTNPHFEIASQCPGWREIVWNGRELTTRSQFI